MLARWESDSWGRGRLGRHPGPQHRVGPPYHVAAVGGLVSVALRAGMAVGEAHSDCVV